jgi:hypothetical protein
MTSTENCFLRHLLPTGASTAGFLEIRGFAFAFHGRTIRILVIGNVSDELGEAAALLRKLESIALFWHFRLPG